MCWIIPACYACPRNTSSRGQLLLLLAAARARGVDPARRSSLLAWSFLAWSFICSSVGARGRGRGRLGAALKALFCSSILLAVSSFSSAFSRNILSPPSNNRTSPSQDAGDTSSSFPIWRIDSLPSVALRPDASASVLRRDPPSCWLWPTRAAPPRVATTAFVLVEPIVVCPGRDICHMVCRHERNSFVSSRLWTS